MVVAKARALRVEYYQEIEIEYFLERIKQPRRDGQMHSEKVNGIIANVLGKESFYGAVAVSTNILVV